MNSPGKWLCLALAAPALAAAAGSATAQSPCSDHAWCNKSLSPEQRADLVLAQMTQDEKFELMAGDDPAGFQTGEPANGTSNGIPRLGVPTMYFNDGPGGIRKGRSTALPAPAALAASFDPLLARRAGQVIGEEAKAKGIHMVHAPAVNIMRVEQGGRTFEYYGEDPFLAARMAAGATEGIQSTGTLANVKHYVANNQETDRFVTNAVVDERTLREVYVPAFEASVNAGVAAVMLSYNRVNGKDVTASPELVNGLLKRDLGFRWFTLTDYAFSQKSTADAANAGTDLEMPQAGWYSRPALTFSVASGRVSPAVIDEHVHRILRTMFHFGVFDKPRPSGTADMAGHAGVARDIAEEGSVLLKNDRGALPLDARRIRSIAVVGPESDAHRSGGGSSKVEPVYAVTPLEGIRRRVGPNVSVRHSASLDPQAAAQTARGADAAVVVVNDGQTEFADKPCLSLQCGDPDNGDQDGLVQAVASANPNTAVVVEAGGPVLMPWVDRVRAVVQAWYPGQEGGNGIAAVLFGDSDPGGRLPQSFPRREQDTATAGRPERYPGIAENASYSEGVFVGYRHYDQNRIAPLFPFGHGLSYTEFEYRDLEIRGDRRPGHGTVEITVKNVGRRGGSEVPQLYVGMPAGPVPQPPKWLKGFQKLRLRPGQSRRVSFDLDPRSFSYWDASARRWAIAPGCYRMLIGASSREIRAEGTLSQGGARCPRNCAAATGRLSGRRLGRLRIGGGRSAHRRAFPSYEVPRPRMDRFCVAGRRHTRVGYATTRARRRGGRRGGRRATRTAVVALTTSSHYAARGVKPGHSTRRMRRARVRRVGRIGRNTWYMRRGRIATLVFKTRRRRVREIGVAHRRLTRTRRQARRLLRAYRL